MTSENWNHELGKYFALKASQLETPDFDSFSEEQHFQCGLVANALIDWLKSHGPRLLLEREIISESLGVDKEPRIIFLSDKLGTAVAAEVLKNRPPMVFYFTKDDFEDFLQRYPDDDYKFHVTYSSCVTQEIEGDSLEKARQNYPLNAGEHYLVHEESSWLAPLFGRGGLHLWKWNGENSVLLEEGFITWIS